MKSIAQSFKGQASNLAGQAQKMGKEQIKQGVFKGINEKINDLVQQDTYTENLLNRGVLLSSTEGLIDYRNDEFTIANPLNSIFMTINNSYRGNNNLNKGIWIGKRALKSLGVNIDFGPIQVNHWAVMIEGDCFSLTTDTGSADGIIQILQTDDKKYNWDYMKELKVNYFDVMEFIRYLNEGKIEYHLLSDNCQRMSLYIAQFAGGEYLGLWDFQLGNQKHINVTAEGIPDTYGQYKKQKDEKLKNLIREETIKQEKIYEDFEKQGFTMYEPTYKQTTLSQTYKQPTTIGSQIQTPRSIQPLRNNIMNTNYSSNNSFMQRTSTNPQFDLNQYKRTVQPFSNNILDKPLFRGSLSNNFQDFQQKQQQQQFNINNNQYQQNMKYQDSLQKKIKMNTYDTSQFDLPQYEYDNNDYTKGSNFQRIRE